MKYVVMWFEQGRMTWAPPFDKKKEAKKLAKVKKAEGCRYVMIHEARETGVEE
jgi:hypothetical protein